MGNITVLIKKDSRRIHLRWHLALASARWIVLTLQRSADYKSFELYSYSYFFISIYCTLMQSKTQYSVYFDSWHSEHSKITKTKLSNISFNPVRILTKKYIFSKILYSIVYYFSISVNIKHYHSNFSVIFIVIRYSTIDIIPRFFIRFHINILQQFHNFVN